MIRPIIEPTEDGTPTLRHPVFGDTYHSTRGATGESMHVYIRQGFAASGLPAGRVFGLAAPVCSKSGSAAA